MGCGHWGRKELEATERKHEPYFYEVRVSKEQYESISERYIGDRLGSDLSAKLNTLAY